MTSAVGGQLQHITGMEEKDTLGRIAHGGSHFTEAHQVAKFPMHGQDIARGSQREHHFQLFFIAVAGDMHLIVAMIDHFSPLAIELVDGAVYEILIARDGRGGDDHQVAGGEFDIFMLAGRTSGAARRAVPPGCRW